MNIPAFEQAAKALNASSAKATAVLADLKEAQRDLASPEECEARRFISTQELLAELKSLTAAIDDDGSDLSQWRERVAKLAEELEEDLLTPNPEPGMDWMPGGMSEPRGEYDNFTQGVRGRGY